jgi:hypothetical protein
MVAQWVRSPFLSSLLGVIHVFSPWFVNRIALHSDFFTHRLCHAHA